MAPKRRAGRSSSLDSKELGIDGGGNKAPDEEKEGSGKFGADHPVPGAGPKETPKRSKKPSTPSPEDAGGQGSGEASPVRNAPRDEVVEAPPRKTLKAKKTSKRVKKSLPPSQEGDEAEDPGEASPARDAPPDDTAAAAADHDKSVVAPKRGKKRSPTPEEDEERVEKRAAGHDDETAAASSPRRKKKSKTSVVKDKPEKKGKKLLRKVLNMPTPTPTPESLDLGLNEKRSLPNIEDEQQGREMAEQEQGSTSLPQDKHTTREEQEDSAHGQEQQEKKIADQEHADDTSPPKDKNSSDEKEQQGEVIPEQEHPRDTSPPQEDRAQEDMEAGAEVCVKTLMEMNALSTKPRNSEADKKPGVERSWSSNDELKILSALVEHAQSHSGALPDSSHLLDNLTFDKIDANEDKLTNKIRKLRARYLCKVRSHSRPSDNLGRQLFKLSEVLWGHVDEDELVDATSRDFSLLSKLYPYLAKEVKAYADTHISGDFIMAQFMTIADEKARDLDAKCKKQSIDAFKLELSQASLTKEVLSALSSLPGVTF